MRLGEGLADNDLIGTLRLGQRAFTQIQPIQHRLATVRDGEQQAADRLIETGHLQAQRRRHALFQRHGKDASELMHHADLAMYQDKSASRLTPRSGESAESCGATADDPPPRVVRRTDAHNH